MSRLTRGDLRDYAAKAVLGQAGVDVTGIDSALLNTFCNQEQEAWRRQFQGVKGLGERSFSVTWTVGNTRMELPFDFAELAPSQNGRITLCDVDGNKDDQLEVVAVGDYEQAWRDGQNPYTDRSDPIAYLLGTSVNDQRFIEVVPAPTTAIILKGKMIAYLEVLDNDADTLEVPLGMQEGVQWGVTHKLAVQKGDARAASYLASRMAVWASFLDPVSDERKRPGRVLSFAEVGGYSGFNNPE